MYPICATTLFAIRPQLLRDIASRNRNADETRGLTNMIGNRTPALESSDPAQRRFHAGVRVVSLPCTKTHGRAWMQGGADPGLLVLTSIGSDNENWAFRTFGGGLRTFKSHTRLYKQVDLEMF